jgi:multiple antibiotic resistance protein
MGVVETFLLCFIPLFVIINPLGTVPAFLSLTEAFRRNRVKIALKVSLTALVILLLFGMTGLHIFNFLGISISAFRIAGGLILLRTAFEMVKGETRTLHSSHYTEDDISVVPLAIPLLAGPGAISTMVVLTKDFSTSYVYSALLLAILCTFLILAASKWVLAVIKERGLRVMIRLLGIILTAMSVQMIITGFVDVMRSSIFA